LVRGFVQLHEACRQGPKTVAGFNRSLAKQNLALIGWNGANYNLRVYVMNCATSWATTSFSVVAGRNAKFKRGATCAAVFHLLFASILLKKSLAV